MYCWTMTTKSQGCIPGVESVRFQQNNVPTQHNPKNVKKNSPFPACSQGFPGVLAKAGLLAKEGIPGGTQQIFTGKEIKN